MPIPFHLETSGIRSHSVQETLYINPWTFLSKALTISVNCGDIQSNHGKMEAQRSKEAIQGLGP